ncbi:MAG: hypothetical protein ACI845_002722 [Gammaproteobacteria bacterium]|jgi:uncharacterized protein (DUF1330 family)
MAGYWVVRGGAIKDQDALEAYGKLWPLIAERFGAEIIAGKSTVETREGPEYPRQLVIRFASYDQAVACYEDPDYKEAMKLAHQAYDRELSILEG